MAEVEVLPEAILELDALPILERDAMERTFVKLRLFGEALGYPHSSQVRGTSLRELRPRQGRSPWRAFYQRLADGTLAVAAIGSEAQHNPRRFRRAVEAAHDRLASRESR